MKRGLLLLTIASAFLILSSLSFVSAGAVTAPQNCTNEKTTILGTVFVQGTDTIVEGAKVTATCNGVIKETTTDALGAYHVQFNSITDSAPCAPGQEVVVEAVKDSMEGDNSKIVTKGITIPGECCCCDINLNIEVINVPLVPEFTLIAGLTTVLGAIATFFIIRRK